MNIKYVRLLFVFIGMAACSSVANSQKRVFEITPEPTNILQENMADSGSSHIISDDQSDGNTSNEQIVALVRSVLENMFKEDLAKDLIPDTSRKFIFFEYDLNGELGKEIFVGLIGPYFCGSGGCTVLLLNPKGVLITRFTVVDYPIVIDTQKNKGWDNLFMLSSGKYHVMKFNGKKYPSNPSMQPLLRQTPDSKLPRALNFVDEPYKWFPF